MLMMTSQILKYYFFFKLKNSQLHMKGYFMTKNSFVAEVTFKTVKKIRYAIFLLNRHLADYLKVYSRA